MRSSTFLMFTVGIKTYFPKTWNVTDKATILSGGIAFMTKHANF